MKALAAACLLVSLAACSSTPKLVPAGGECFYVTDCAAGLICVAKAGTNPPVRECSKDVSATESAVPGADGGTRDAQAALDGQAPLIDAGAQPIVDAAAD
ncbi:MAG: hypothetical protein KBF88_08620 [Polyangiaceae bacterium]|nr:hypothetical protein [Polyangiaceae bacterium]